METNKDFSTAIYNLASKEGNFSVQDLEFLMTKWPGLEVYVNLESGDPKEAEIIKNLIGIILQAKEKGLIDFELGEPEILAARIESRLTRAKTTYLINNNKVKTEEAIDILIDNCAANIVAVINDFLDSPFFSEFVTAAIVAALPELAEAAPLIKTIVQQCVPYIKKFAHALIKGVSEFIKALIKPEPEVAKPAAEEAKPEPVPDKNPEGNNA